MRTAMGMADRPSPWRASPWAQPRPGRGRVQCLPRGRSVDAEAHRYAFVLHVGAAAKAVVGRMAPSHGPRVRPDRPSVQTGFVEQTLADALRRAGAGLA